MFWGPCAAFKCLCLVYLQTSLTDNGLNPSLVSCCDAFVYHDGNYKLGSVFGHVCVIHIEFFYVAVTMAMV